MRSNRTTLLQLAAMIAVGMSLALVPAGAPGPANRLEAAAPSTFQKGISYATWWSGQYSDPGADLSLERLADTGAGWISLIVTAYQETPGSTVIDRTDPQTPTDADLIHVIQNAHALGLKVMLKPHLDLRNEEENGWWRGNIGEDFASESEWLAWFAAYRGFIAHYAALAESYGADQFCIGTELLGTTHRTADWRAVVAGVRAAYSGPITYAALHSGEEMAITWWDAVDAIGVDAYYPLFFDPLYHPTVAELEASWLEPKAVMAELAATYQMPILLTEIGYRSHHGCAQHPWDSLADSALDMEEQANAYEAAFRQLYDEPWLGGLFWWTWHPDRFKSGRCDDGYSPHQKPAEAVLRAWYGGGAVPPSPVLLPDIEPAGEIYTDELVSAWGDWSWDVTLDPTSTRSVYSGQYALETAAAPWGALSLHNNGLDTSPYTWIEFFVYSEMEIDLQLFLAAADGTPLPSAPVEDCRHVAGGVLSPGAWQRVRIPLSELNPENKLVTRINIQNATGGEAVQYWLDEMRLVGGTLPSDQVFLPLAVH